MRVFMGFTGVKQAGKTTAFKYIQEKYPFVQEVALADKLKNECARIFSIPRANFDAPELKEKDLKNPVYLDGASVTALLEGFGLTFEFDKHVRPHIGTILHTPRQVAQYVGTEVLRALDEDVHCNGPVRDLPEDGFFIVTDMRFHNEFDFFAKNYPGAFYPFYINNFAAEAKSSQDSHASEKYILEIGKKCEVVNNNGNMEDLRTQIVSAFEAILKKHSVKP